MLDAIELSKKLVSELRELAKSLNVSNYDSLKKDDLIIKIIESEFPAENVTINELDDSINLSKTKRKRKTSEPVLFTKSKPVSEEIIPSELMIEDDEIHLTSPIVKQNDDENDIFNKLYLNYLLILCMNNH